MTGSLYNTSRSELYVQVFTNVVRGHDEHDAEMQDAHANLLIDIRWADVARRVCIRAAQGGAPRGDSTACAHL